MLIFAPMNTPLFSIRMRASRRGEHISGAERIAAPEQLDQLSAALMRRALEHSRGVPDDIRITVEVVDPSTVVYLPLPDITTVRVADVATGRQAALAELTRAGVSEAAAIRAMGLLAHGAAPDGGPLRGAMLVEAASGARLEPDPQRGVRASHMDLAPAAATQLHALLAERGLDNEHVREALVLATKVMHLPGFVAELCWSDDPDYSAGYVCTPGRGYVRFPFLKPLGDPHGGRAFFVRGNDFQQTVALEWLQRTVVLCDRVGTIRQDETWPQ